MRRTLLIALALAASSTGCVTPPSAYVTHPFQTIHPDQIATLEKPLRLQVVSRRYRGAQLHDDASPWVHSGAVQALKKSRVVQPSHNGEDGKIIVVVREVEPTARDTAHSVAKGILAGLTLGAIGSTSTGEFDVSLEILRDGSAISHPPVRVNVSFRMGSASVPPGLQSYRDADDALKQALSDAILWTIWEMQNKGLIPKK